MNSEWLGLMPSPQSSRYIWSFRLFLGCPVFLLPLVWYCRSCYGILYLSVPCKCCSRFRWYCCISRKISCTPSLSLTDWFLSPSNLVIPICVLKTSLCYFQSLFTSFLQHSGLTTEFQGCCFGNWPNKWIKPLHSFAVSFSFTTKPSFVYCTRI